MLDQRCSDNDLSRRDIPSFIEPRPPLIQNPFMRPKPQKGTNLLELFEEDSEIEEPELVQVYLRLKPCSVPNSLYEVRSDRCLVTSLDTATAGHGRRTQHNVSKMYTFSKIFGPESNQKQIFEQVVKDNLRKLPDGHNFTLLTYGASGSGKTYTLMGTVGSPGLVPRSLEYVFRLVEASQQPLYKPAENGAEKLDYAEQDFELQWVKRLRHVSAPLRDKYRRMSVQLHSDLTISSIDLSNRVRYYVWVSFVEIYNEAIYDLLAPPDKRTKLRIREDSSGNVYVKGATQAFVRSGEEAYDVMVAGKHNLVVAATGVHAHSSRSHCIFTITMLTETGDGGVRTSCVRLCDLAGCERARATRNTGTRMAESRAINSSLHVLERCLHMLRRKQRMRNEALVPYRESKLTRLLGTGLSGARGEAVSMVVTLNPSPEYAHETKHVLTLAAVAQDIQINNTILGTTLESSTQDTTIACSAEVMKLRADNERLHFELVQAQARNKELMASMEERQQETANTMRELVEEAKDMTRQYYEAQLEALRSEMEDMIEEYEARLAHATKKEAPPSNAGTPSRYLQTKVAQLMTEITVLEEQLTAERLARARAEKEVQHLHTCIEERDNDDKALSSLRYRQEKAELPELEKNFKELPPSKDVSDSEHESDDDSDPFNESLEPIFKKEMNKSIAKQNDTISVHSIDNIDEEGDINQESNDTIKCNDDSDISKKDSAINDSDSTTNVTYENTGINSINSTYNDDSVKDANNSVERNDVTNELIDIDINDIQRDLKSSFVCRGTYFVSDSKLNNESYNDKSNERIVSSCRGTYFVSASDCTATGKNVKDDIVFKEPIIKVNDTKIAEHVSETLVNKIIESFKSNHNNDNSLQQFEQLEMAAKECDNDPIEKHKVTKMINSLKSTQSNDNSLRQFEQLEMAAKECDDDIQNQSVFGNIKILKEKRNYFDNEPKTDEPIDDMAVVFTNKEKRTYFDNIDVNVEVASKKINEIIKLDEERSPSIVKENVVSDNFEASKIKRLLGESFTKPEIVTSVQKNRLAKKQASVDIFDSPLKTTEKDNIEIARQSIEKLVLYQSAKKVIRDTELISQMKPKTILSPKKNDHVSPKKDTVASTIKKDLAQSSMKTDALQSSKKNDKAKINTENITEALDEIKKVIKLEPTSSIEDIKTDIKKEKLEPVLSIEEPNETTEITNKTAEDNTIEEFENIYKDITAPRATEFELLVTQSINESLEKVDKEETKYNLRKKLDVQAEKAKVDDEVLLESQAKCESKVKKRPLRLRRRKNQSDEENVDKLKDIVNLQSEYSDVTMDIPAPQKHVKDIPSPEKEAEENLPPMGVQSCPARSITRSRRKLFTPRAEPLEESLSQTGDSNERVYVPRPSYHRPRARRKL